MKEVFRRALLALCLFSGLWLICDSSKVLYSVRLEDWQDERDLASREASSPGETQKRLQELIDKETKGDLIEQQGGDWVAVWAGISRTLAGEPPSASWQKRLGRSFYDDHVFFAPAEPPFKELGSSLTESDPAATIKVTSGAVSRYLMVTRRTGGDVSRYAPTSLAYPGRFAGFLLLMAGTLLYGLIPWQKHGPEAVRYSRPRASVVPDIMGSVLAGLFFALPILITNDNGMGDGPFSPGWVILTGVMWLMALFGVSLWVISAWYASLLLELGPESLRLKTLTQDATIPFQEISLIEVDRIDNVKLNRTLIILSLLISWKAVGPALLASGPEYGLIFHLKSGRRLTFPLKAAIGLPQLIGRLMDLGLPLSESVFDLFEGKRGSPALRASFPPLPKGAGQYAALASFVLPMALLAFLHLPQDHLVYPSDGDLSKPPASAANKEWIPSAELMAEESRIQSEMTKLQKRMKELEEVVKSGSPEQRRAAAQESEECLEQMMKLSEEFENKRKAEGAPY